jgi:hypothetical protein
MMRFADATGLRMLGDPQRHGEVSISVQFLPPIFQPTDSRYVQVDQAWRISEATLFMARRSNLSSRIAPPRTESERGPSWPGAAA